MFTPSQATFVESITIERPVRSYVLRGGRLTPGQRRALDSLWSRFGLDAHTRLDWGAVFGRQAPRLAEVGFGDGQALLALAEAHPERDYIGIDVHPPGVGRLLAGLQARQLRNVRVFRADAVAVFEQCIPDDTLEGICVWFPDPWPKKRHHKRRLIQPSFVSLVSPKLVSGGRLHLATDWMDYAQQMLKVLEAQEDLVNLAGPRGFSPECGERPMTRFAQRGERLGHSVWDLIFEKR